jgi:hypothetical protein
VASEPTSSSASAAIIRCMTLLALTIKAHTGIRLAELGFLAGAIGGVLLMLGGNRRWAMPCCVGCCSGAFS